ILDGPGEGAGRLQGTEDDSSRSRGRVRATGVAECRRCLAPARQAVGESLALLSAVGPRVSEVPSRYRLDGRSGAVDVASALREEVALRVTAFPLCDDECKGLCPRWGESLNAGPCGCTDTGTNT